MDNTAFLVNLLRVKQQVVGPVMEDKQAGILHTFARHRHVAHIVYCLVNRRVGIQILSEFHPDAFKPAYKLIAGKILSSVKAHVLKEVGQSTLWVLLLNRTYLLGYVKISLPFGIFIMPDIICKAVVKMTYTHGAVDRNRRQLRHLAIHIKWKQGSHRRSEQEQWLKILLHYV